MRRLQPTSLHLLHVRVRLLYGWYRRVHQKKFEKKFNLVYVLEDVKFPTLLFQNFLGLNKTQFTHSFFANFAFKKSHDYNFGVRSGGLIVSSSGRY